MIVLSSNENPLGPGKTVMRAVRAAFGEGGRAPGRYSGTAGDLIDATAKRLGVKPENIVLGCGSTQILRTATHLFTAKDKPLVGTIPTYEECTGYAEMMGHAVRAVALDSEFRIDLGKFADAAKGAGLVFYCNPNNPTATYVGAKATRDFLAKVQRESPDTTILVDEAYFEYVTDPDHDTHIAAALDNPRVIVARTFSKAYGMAGLRMGFAVGHADTIKKMREWDAGSGVSSLNVLALHAGLAAIKQDATFITSERARNAASRDFTMKWFADRGMKPTASQANFMFVNIGRPAKGFREACRAKGVLVARDFPPFEKTHCRIAFGTMDEMQKAVAVFGQVLGKTAATAA
jgi:histidinol-phosphate aminotransferase